MQKELGQHFLIDKNILKKISSIIGDSCKVVEIGGGSGKLTEFLKNIEYVVEKDYFLYLELKKKFPNLKILHTNCFNLDISTDYIVGNLPYNISRNFIIHCYFKNNYKKMFFLIQKEMADRFINSKGKNYGALSVFFQLTHKIIKHFDVSPNVFFPRPKVYSSFISFEKTRVLDKKYLTLLENIFHNRRKKFLDTRPDAITPDEYKKILEIV